MEVGKSDYLDSHCLHFVQEVLFSTFVTLVKSLNLQLLVF